jgi:hypothetical protein
MIKAGPQAAGAIAHLLVEGFTIDRLGAGGADDVLGQHVEAGRAAADRRRARALRPATITHFSVARNCAASG